MGIPDSIQDGINKSAAIVPVAGLSSRMGSFKPLLTLNGFAMVRLAVQSAFDGGASRVCVVTGRQSEDIQGVIRGINEGTGAQWDRELWSSISFVHNPAFASTDMLYSLKLGLRSLLEDERSNKDVGLETGIRAGEWQEELIDAVFVLPADVAAVAPRTFGALHALATEDEALVFRPEFEGRSGHPLLLKRPCFEAVLGFDGDGGLREALRCFRARSVAVADEGVLLDADEGAAFDVLAAYTKRAKGLSRSLTEKLLDDFGTPCHIRAHCAAVSELAVRMARRLNAHGQCLDSELCRSAAALHDMNRLDAQHSRVAAAHLRGYGYDAVARVVGDHDNAQDLDVAVFTESLIVFVADKLVKESQVVTLEERYGPALARFSEETSVGQRIRRDKALCAEAIRRYEEMTGDHLYRARAAGSAFAPRALTVVR